MNCPKCSQPTDTGAAFCGNCSQALHATPDAASPMAQAFAVQSVAPRYGQSLAPLAVAGAQGVPAYALTTPVQHSGETKAVLSIVLGVIGIAAALFVALAGLALGVAGLVFGTMSRSAHKRTANIVGIVFSSLAIVASLAVWTYVLTHNAQSNASAKTAASRPPQGVAIAANNVTTACYNAGFTEQYNISTAENSCDMQAYDGSTLATASDAYKVYGYKQPALNSTNFTGFAKQALEKDVSDNLPGFTVDKESVGQFAGSTAYIINASNQDKGVAYVEAAVLHQGSTGYNIFIFVHAIADESTNLDAIEAQWQWK